eukprot:GHVU01159936.1.p1 GENE.GHVU01159936.1~~GHVU01159936.1.p1  ORF type:complete len:419 (+),score=92.53 GHVU01159936.1:411-1667(+)
MSAPSNVSNNAQGGTWWIVGCNSSPGQGREAIHHVLRPRVIKANVCTETAVFQVPLTMKYGSFDELVRLVDDLQKHDTYCENVLRRVERQTMEIDAAAELLVSWQHHRTTASEYIRRFSWDELRYPHSRLLRDNLDLLLAAVQQYDEEIRNKAHTFHDLERQRNQKGAAKPDAASYVPYASRNLVEVLTPSVVSAEDFCETEHLTTAVAIVPRGAEKEWLATYEALDEYVVPRSSKKFEAEADAKDGSTLWSVVVFRSRLDDFKIKARQRKIIVRPFSFSPAAYDKHIIDVSSWEAERQKQRAYLSRLCLVTFSEVFCAWVHVKAMRVFVEAVLRFGLPPNFAAFVLKMAPTAKESRLRQELTNIFTSEGMFGKSYVHSETVGSKLEPSAGRAADPDEEEYFPYVSLTISPYSTFVES